MYVGVSVSVCRCSLRFLRLGWVLSTWEMAVHLTATSHVLVSVLSFAVFFLRFFFKAPDTRSVSVRARPLWLN